MIKRRLQKSVIDALGRFPAVALLGARQVGKTTLAKEIFNLKKVDGIYLDMERESDRNKVADPELYLTRHANKLVVIDEVQHRANLFPALRVLIDENRRPGRFLLLGSASPDLLHQSSESLAGRIKFLELTPFSLDEIKTFDPDNNRLWLRGGYPLSYMAENDADAFEWLDSFISTYLTRDIPQLGIHVPAIQLKRFFSMVAHTHGQLLNASKLASSLGVTSPTVSHYLQIFQDTYLLRTLQPWYSNLKKRLVKSPKIYLRDSGILHTLLNTHSIDALLGHPAAGASWEGFVIEQIISRLQPSTDYSFYRTAGGGEVDLILHQGTKVIAAIEIKLSLTPKCSRAMTEAMRDLGCDKGYIIYPGTESYPLSPTVLATSIHEMEQIPAIAPR
ncbi:MAG: ATP-binding protein [Spartobacteria bacterium]|nr:ATP-binding protein [Spartobacteria bacterium]